MGGLYQRSLKGNLQMCWELRPHLGSGSNTSGFQYFTLLVWKNYSAFEKHRISFYLYALSFSAMVLLFFAVCLVDIRWEDSSSSTIPLPGTPAGCLDRVLGSELGADDLLVCRSRQPVEAGKQQGLEQETGPHLSASRAWRWWSFRYIMSLCLSREVDVDFSVLIPFSFLSCLQRRYSEKCRAFFARKLQWGFEIAKMHSVVQGLGVNNSFDLSMVMLLAFLLAECHCLCSTEVPSNVSEV